MPTAPDKGVSGADVVSYARTQLGDPYVWAAEGPDAFDCSGLVQYVYKRFGISTPRTTSAMMGPGSNFVPVDRAQLAAGDLIFSNWTGQRSSHVGIYDGAGGLIEAPAPGKNVTVTPLGPGYWSHVDAIRRVPGVNGTTGQIRGSFEGPTGGTGVNGMINGFFSAPQNITEALTNVGTGMANVANSAASVAKLAELGTRLFLPTTLIRGVALVFGTIFLLIGIWYLGREIKEASA